jgi:HTH-type transcriptional regulator/antitoxin HigA
MKRLKVLKTTTDYKNAVTRSMQIFHAEKGTPESDELDLLLVQIKDYEDKHITIPSADL